MENRKPKILYVEDDVNLGFVTKDNLQKRGLDITLCEDGLAAAQVFQKQKFDLVILDVMMPKLDGFTVAKLIREEDKSTPVFFLTAKGMKEDVLTGYQSGGDDFLSKPFDTDVLLMKIRAMLNRSMGLNDDSGQQLFTIGKYSFDYKFRTIKIDEVSLQLSPKEAELLRLLCLHKNDLLPRNKALKLIWGDDNYFNGRSMDVFITRLRKYLRNDPSIEIISLHGKGVRLVVPESQP